MYSKSGFPSSGRETYGTLVDPSYRYSKRAIASSKPRVVVSIRGIKALATKVSVVLYAQGVGDTAEITLGSEGNPDWSDVLKDVGAEGSIIVEVRAGFANENSVGGTADFAQLKQIFLGLLNQETFRSDGFETSFSCTSLATLLMVSKQTTLYQGMTTQDFMTRVAADTGLSLNYELRKGQKPLQLRAVFAEDFVVGVHNVEMWKMANACASADDAWLSLQGNTLNYVSPFLSPKRKHFILIYGGGYIKSWEGQHSPQYAKNIRVEVRTYSRHTAVSTSVRVSPGDDSGAVIQTASTTITPDFGTKGTSSVRYNSSTGTYSYVNRPSSGGFFNSGDTVLHGQNTSEPYIEHIPNLTPDECNQRAIAEWRKRSRAEYKATFVFPVTPEYVDLETNSVFEFYECPQTAFNSSPSQPAYFQQRLTYDIDVKQGWMAKAECVNHVLAIENAGSGL